MPLRAAQKPMLTRSQNYGGGQVPDIPGSYDEPTWEEEKVHMFSTWMHSDHPYGADLGEYFVCPI